MVKQTKLWERSILSRGRTELESCYLPLSTTDVLRSVPSRRASKLFRFYYALCSFTAGQQNQTPPVC